MAIKYVFKDEPVIILNAKRANAQRIGEALAKVTDANKGRLTPSAIVEAAKDTRSALHRHFLWDDVAAAQAYREQQARELVRLIRIETEDAEEPIRAFLSVKDGAGTSYRTAAEVAGSVDLQLAVLRQAERDLDAFTRRYKELQDVCADVASARDKARSRRESIEARAQ